MRQKKPLELPTTEQLETAASKRKYRSKLARTIRSTLFALITVSAVAILVATLWLPVFQIYGTSMTPTLADGQLVLAVKNGEFETGDLIAFYYNNKILVKRVIAQTGDWVNISEDGTVYVNNIALDEPYVLEPSIGDCNIELPYQVPESRIFVMGDHRSVSVDSRNTSVGCVAEEQIVGRLLFRIWPLHELAPLNAD